MNKEDIFTLANKEHFTVLIVTPNSIKDRDWMHVNYLYDLVKDTFCKYIDIHPDNYMDSVGSYLEVTKHIEPFVKVQLISEEKDYITEILYIDNENKEVNLDELNEFATLLNINGDKVYGNAIISRTYVSSTDNTMHFENITPEKIHYMLHKRANTTVISYDSDTEEYKEISILGPMDKFAEMYFGEKMFNIKKIELPFLKHNINIWYTEDTYGSLDVFGNLLPELTRVDKMLVFSMWTDDYRDSFTLEEFNKIKYLSKKLTDYIIPSDSDYLKEEKDELNRNIIKNKYKILHQFYENNK